MHRLMTILLMTASFGINGIVAASGIQLCQDESAIPASTPTARFIDNGNGTVSDTATSLMWAKCSEGLSGSDCTSGTISSIDWKLALDTANSSTLGGYRDWRLPNVKELQSIIELQCDNPAINLDVFPGTATASYWSSSPSMSSTATSWMISFQTGTIREESRDQRIGRVRLIRGSQ